MCAIIDANVCFEAFGPKYTDAGKFFLNWLNRGQGRLVVGGRVLVELRRNSNFKKWFVQASQAGRVRHLKSEIVNQAEESLTSARVCKSDDQHIIALAQVSGARLLFSNDLNLRSDFKNSSLVGGKTKGHVFSTRQSKNVTKTHKELVSRADLCKYNI